MSTQSIFIAVLTGVFAAGFALFLKLIPGSPGLFGAIGQGFIGGFGGCLLAMWVLKSRDNSSEK